MTKKSLITSLKRLFSTGIVVRHTGGEKTDVIDNSRKQVRDNLFTRYKEMSNYRYKGIYGRKSRNRQMLYKDYKQMDRDPVISGVLDIYADECTQDSEDGDILTISTDDSTKEEILDNLYYDILNLDFNLWSWVRNLPVKWDTVIPLLDGTHVTIKELSEKIKNGEEAWVYSIQDKTNKIVPGKVVWCDKNYTANKIFKITLDDDTYVECAGEHPFILRDGSSIRADELKPGMSLMPLYRDHNDTGYETIYNPENNKYNTTHKLVVGPENLKNKKDRNEKKHIYCKNCGKLLAVNQKKFCSRACANTELNIVHHKDFNKYNNTPKNLKIMNFIEHSKYHSEHAKKILFRPDVIKKRMKGLHRYHSSDRRKELLSLQSKRQKGIYPKHFEKYNSSSLHKEHDKRRSKNAKKQWRNNRDELIKKMKIKWSDEMRNIYSNSAKAVGLNREGNTNWIKLHKSLLNNKKFIELWKEVNTRKFTKNSVKSYTPKIANHKVKSIEIINHDEDVYCMTVLGKNGEHDRHNFAVCSKDASGKYTNNGVFVKNCKYGDHFLKLSINDKYGIINAETIHTSEVKREETEEDGKTDIKFSIDSISTQKEFENFEIAHFRLLSDTEFMPYGKSAIEGARNSWKRLTLLEDAMIVHRIVRAPEKRIIKIDVGNLPPNEVDSYIEKIVSKMKREPFIDEDTGEYNLSYNMSNITEDFILPVRGDRTNSEINSLQGLRYEATKDVEYIRKKMLAALKVPKSFIGYEDNLGGDRMGSTLSMEDIRFSRTIQRIQKIVVSELYKLAQIHLYIHGYRDDELSDFKISLTNPSVAAEEQKLELLDTKVRLADSLGRDLNLFSKEWVYKNVFNLSDDDIKDEKGELVQDNYDKYRYEQLSREGVDNGDEPKEPSEGDEDSGGGSRW